MSQITFASNATPSLSNLDANFTALFELRELISSPGYTAATPKMKFTSGSELLWGKTAADTTNAGLIINPPSLNYGRIDFVKASTSGTGATTACGYYYNGGSVGSIACTSTATSFNTSSDYRLKMNVSPMDCAAALRSVMAWPLREFEFIAQPGVRVKGAIAHEMQDVSPLAVTGKKDEEELVPKLDADGQQIGVESRMVAQGIDWSKLVPELAGAVQHLANELEAVKRRLSELSA